ncbi:hypothetical protein [Fretibacter rubidus]|uniref:hypothetical protein n=1 Tax=Fretibacter rubidus TaxID=570162 RepID=UPI00352AB9BF
MTDDLKHLIDIYGADSARWPAHLRAQADTALRANPSHAETAAALDNALDSHVVAKPSDLLRARILKAAKAESKTSTSPHGASNDRPRGKTNVFRFAAAAAALMVCAVVGYQTLSPSPTTDQTIWVEAANDLGIEDLYAWVEGET